MIAIDHGAWAVVIAGRDEIDNRRVLSRIGVDRHVCGTGDHWIFVIGDGDGKGATRRVIDKINSVARHGGYANGERRTRRRATNDVGGRTVVGQARRWVINNSAAQAGII